MLKPPIANFMSLADTQQEVRLASRVCLGKHCFTLVARNHDDFVANAEINASWEAADRKPEHISLTTRISVRDHIVSLVGTTALS